MKSSKFLSLDLNDFLKGLIMAVLAAVLAIVKTTIEAGSLNFDFPTIGKYALLAALAYITKNLLTNSRDEFAKPEPK